MKFHHHGTNGSVPHGKPKPRPSPTAASARAHNAGKPGFVNVNRVAKTGEPSKTGWPKVKGHHHHD